MLVVDDTTIHGDEAGVLKAVIVSDLLEEGNIGSLHRFTMA